MVNRRPPAWRGQAGFTYLMVLLAVAMIGAGLGAVGQVWGTVQQREKEAELLFIGNQFRQAIKAYVEKGPGGARTFPRQLSDLLEDNRYPAIQRYLRKIYRDPITNSLDWGLVKAPDGGIIGVFSRSEAKPLKVAGFAARDARLENATKYSDWVFLYDNQAQAPPPQPKGTPGAPGAPGGTELPPFLPPEGKAP